MQFHYQHVFVEALGYTLPATSITSEDLEHRLRPVYERLKLPAGRLELMSGITARRLWPASTSISDISISSCRQALRISGLSSDQVQMLAHGSVCRDHLEPATACRVHHELGLPAGCQIFDVSNACLGIMNGMVLAANMIELGQIPAALVVGSENGRGLVESTVDELNQNPSFTRKSIKNTFASLTIGSASCAVLLTRGEAGRRGCRLLGGAVTANTAFNELCQSQSDRAGGGMAPLMETDSETLMVQGIETGKATFPRFLAAVGWSRESIDRTVCHQVGSAHRKLMLDSLRLDPERDAVTFPWLGNTGSAALPVTLCRAIEDEICQPHHRVALLGIGSGINCLMLALEGCAIPVSGVTQDTFGLDSEKNN